MIFLSDKNDETNYDMIQKQILKLREEIITTKDKKIDHLEDLIMQKDAKIKLFDSRIKVLQVNINFNELSN